MDRKLVYSICKVVALPASFDPIFVLAVCEQESAYHHDAARLENGFYHRYTEKDSLATSSELLLACSYGLMQTMGQSLREIGYFDWFRNWYDGKYSPLLQSPLSQMTICKGVDEFMQQPSWQVEWGTKWLDRKRKAAGGDEKKMLLLWNGGGRPQYADEVFARVELLKKINLEIG